MNILVVDDNSPFRVFLRKILIKKDYKVFLAENGIKALEILETEDIDAVLTDWMMPLMDGMELVKAIREKFKNPPAIIVITALALKEAFDKALAAGADEYLPKPVSKEAVLNTLKNVLERRGQDLAQREIESQPTPRTLPEYFGIGIAASTGGPITLVSFLSKLKASNKLSYFIVLHGPDWMLRSFVERVREKCELPVHLGREGLSIKPGCIYISPGESHMIINPKNMQITLSDAPPENYVKPSADPLFRSIAAAFGNKSIGIILTGMGHDGTLGAGYIRTAGGFIIAQDPATAVIPSMPKSIIDLNIAHKTAKIAEIQDIITHHIN